MKSKKQIVGGIHAVTEALNAGKELHRVYIRKGLHGDHFVTLFRMIRERNIPFQYVPAEKLNRISNINHQGIIAELSLIEYKAIEEVIQRTFEQGEDPVIIVLDGLTDVRNFGAIARTAECAGVHAIVIPAQGSVSITTDAIKVSSGALHRIPVCRTVKLPDTLSYLKNSGIKLVGASEKAQKNHYETDLSGPVAFVLGSEEKGISASVKRIMDDLIKIPIRGQVESLNVSVACGIILFESLRQRTVGG